MKHYIGIDLGGTNIAAGVVDDQGRLLSRAELPTRAERPWQEVTQDMALASEQAVAAANLSLADIQAVGMGVPGIAIDGTIPFCTNLGWHNIPMEKAFRQYIDKPLFIDNDANVAGLAEAVSGVSAGIRNSVFLTLGTGLGAGIILDGKAYSGSHGVGGELGHMIFMADGELCTCGKRGCWERYASATALIRMGVESCLSHPDSPLGRQYAQDPASIDAKAIIDASKAGDPVAGAVFKRYVHYLALGINSIISFIDPEMVVIGGGVSKAGPYLLDAVRAALPDYIFFKTLPYARVELAILGNDAGIIGAAMLGRS